MAIDKRALWEWRATRRLSRRALAELADVSESTVESIENGRHPPSLRSMRRIAGVFDVGLDAIDWEAGARERDAKTLAPVA